MRIVAFSHSLRSCWNHGNAHFLRGVLCDLQALGHEVAAWEPADGWSSANLVADHGEAAIAASAAAYPTLAPRLYGPGADPAEMVDGADLVLVHEWTAPEIVHALGALRARGAGFRLLFHDTHHRAVSAPHELQALDLSAYDGVLAFCEALAEVYRGWGWGARAYVWHEAADVARFQPPAEPTARTGAVFIGNWGDGEREEELTEFLFAPLSEAGVPLDVHGVRYPAAALATLQRHGARYRGWLANAETPRVYAQKAFTVHVPRRFYVTALPGAPTIRVFEALACGVPLLSAPWTDCEGLFRADEDYLVAGDHAAMARLARVMAADPDRRAALAASGLARIRARHTTRHRALELLEIALALDAAEAPREARA